MTTVQRTALEYALELAQRERARIEVVIGFLSERLASGDRVGADDATPEGSNAASLVTPGEFHGLTSTAAAELVLRRLGPDRPARTVELLEAVWKGGVRIAGRDPAQTMYRSLFRNKKKFVKVGISLWALVVWAPEPIASHETSGEA